MGVLFDILENCFTPRYCLENYSDLFHGSDGEFKIAFPMTCFCDLPLSQLHKHLDFYGGYGIGLKKEWGIDKKINPVLYMHQNSDFSDYIGTLIRSVKGDNTENRTALQYLMSILRHIKLYEGSVTIDGRKIYKKFYDEREWRWVPFLSGNSYYDLLSLTEEEFNDPKTLKTAQYDVTQSSRLEFGAEDIKYIVVSSENEVNVLVDKISSMRNRYSEKEVRILCTKILNSEQIKTDF